LTANCAVGIEDFQRVGIPVLISTTEHSHALNRRLGSVSSPGLESENARSKMGTGFSQMRPATENPCHWCSHDRSRNRASRRNRKLFPRYSRWICARRCARSSHPFARIDHVTSVRV